jgi:starch phosphorylase
MEFDAEKFKKNLEGRLRRQYGKDITQANKHDLFDAVSASALEIIMPNWMETRREYDAKPARQLYYLSAEFLMGRALSNNLINAGIKDKVIEVLNGLELEYDMVEDEEPDAGLGNGGLGRLAACFLDSLATLEYPGNGYGIRYEYGMFEQHIIDGEQVEFPDNWLKHRDPWEVKRSDLAVTVKFGGQIKYGKTPDGQDRFYIENAEEITATPYDMPVVGFGCNTVNTLRLWQASSPNGFDLQLFNDMQYNRAVERQNNAENITRVLYPNDNGPLGKELRLKQQYFFTSASLQDLVHQFVNKVGTDFSKFPDYHVIQLNDTHPVVAIPELMRILMDDYNVGWDEAWMVVQKTFAYTNHTILAEALEKWPIETFKNLLPRIYQIVEEINRRFMIELRAKFPNDYSKQNHMAIIHDGKVYMAWLAIHAGFSVNGVAELHTKLLKEQELKDWCTLYPQKFNNKTNGVTQRRWVLSSNPELAEFITERIGHGWETDLTKLKALEKFADDDASLTRLMEIKQHNKDKLADYLKHAQNVLIDSETIFDTQVKRLHEYKRQLLNILHVMYVYNQLKDNPNMDIYPRTYIFGAKAAAGYQIAKKTIKLINNVANVINNDRSIGGKLKVVFIEDYRVSNAEIIFAAADVSEQISTASKEASGTGNMKFMLNGALTIGTMDGATVEMVEEMGQENAFIFGLSSDEVINYEKHGGYNPQEIFNTDQDIRRVLMQLINGFYSPEDPELFRDIYNSLLNTKNSDKADPYFILKDFRAYDGAQMRVEEAYRDEKRWAKSAILNVACSGKFSSDRTIEEYVKDIWKLKKIQVDVDET